jgi:hypothetical protein
VFLHRQGRNLQSMIIVLLDQLAKELNLVRLPDESDAKPAAAPPPSSSGPFGPGTNLPERQETPHGS